jgi:hypothetical protein
VTHPYAGGTHGQLIQERCTPTRVMIWLDLGLCYGSTVLVEFGFRGHTDTYRKVVYGHGAFELCLPSLGSFYQNSLLRLQILGRTPKTKRTRGREGHGPPCHILGSRRPANIRGCRTDRPSGPPDCVSTMSNISSVISAVLSNLFGRFGLVAAAGKGW